MTNLTEMMDAAIFLWEAIPWIANSKNSFHSLPNETQQALSAFGAGIRRLKTQVDFETQGVSTNTLAEFEEFKVEAARREDLYRQKLEQLTQQLQLLGAQKDQASRQAQELQAKVSNQGYTAEDMARLEGRLAVLNQTVEILTDRNKELENLLEGYKNPTEPTGNWKPSSMNPLRSIT